MYPRRYVTIKGFEGDSGSLFSPGSGVGKIGPACFSHCEELGEENGVNLAARKEMGDFRKPRRALRDFERLFRKNVFDSMMVKIKAEIKG